MHNELQKLFPQDEIYLNCDIYCYLLIIFYMSDVLCRILVAPLNAWILAHYKCNLILLLLTWERLENFLILWEPE